MWNAKIAGKFDHLMENMYRSIWSAELFLLTCDDKNKGKTVKQQARSWKNMEYLTNNNRI